MLTFHATHVLIAGRSEFQLWRSGQIFNLSTFASNSLQNHWCDWWTSIACGRRMSTESSQAMHVTSALSSGKEVSPTEHKLPPGPGGGIQKYGYPANGSATVRPISPPDVAWLRIEITQPSPFPLSSPRAPALFAQAEWLQPSRAIFGSGEVEPFVRLGFWMLDTRS
jgi:hypothetical protein